MRKTVLFTTTMLTGLALATAASADSHSMNAPAKSDTPATEQTQDRSTVGTSTEAEIKTSTDAETTFRSFNSEAEFSGTIAGGYTAEELIGTDLVGPSGDTVGEISDLLIDENNEVRRVLVDVGGFLGIGEKRVALDLSELTREGDDLRTSMTEEQLESQISYVEDGDMWSPFDDDAARPAQ